MSELFTLLTHPRYIKATVEKLKKAKESIDATGEKIGSGPISWADLIFLAGKTTSQVAWRESKVRGEDAGGEATWAHPSAR